VPFGWEHDVKRVGCCSERFVKRQKSLGSESTAFGCSGRQYSSSSFVAASSDDGEAASRAAVVCVEGSPVRCAAAEADRQQQLVAHRRGDLLPVKRLKLVPQCGDAADGQDLEQRFEAQVDQGDLVGGAGMGARHERKSEEGMRNGRRCWVEGDSEGVDAADGAYARRMTASDEAASDRAALRPSAKRGVESVWTCVAVEGGC
jgi:hypothetical protein